MNIAIIPARGGSQRIPHKNIRPFCGKPMIAWSIGTACKSGLFDHILVSTDDPEIAHIAEQSGADVPFVRPAELANDYASTIEVIAHAVRWIQSSGWQPDAVCCLYATAPFICPDDLRNGLELLKTRNCAYTFAATEYPSSIFRSFRLHSDGSVEMFFPEHFVKRSQDLPTAFHDAGQFYWGRPHVWLASQPLFNRDSCPLLIPRWRVQDIDTEDDWKRAELIWRMLNVRYHD